MAFNEVKKLAMPKGTVLTAILLGFALTVSYGQSKQGVQITQETNRLHIEINGEPFADYIFKGYAKPFLYPMFGPGGAHMTRDWPMKETPNEEHDHPHRRPGSFLGRRRR